ncbi:HPr kinase/phosphorylase [Methylobacterium tardum]|uniref:PqqD family peptide modification chaperone n=1 Tax=Methylobacterium tardum TaxID=374432 RepID=UPI001EE04582|nr:PqqD family peptide modification chaperone [Methylobacterium tardum]URD40296.1 PqqD family peptide modification chaperone [Methylobacterium tardum]GJE53218.1 HPr kinase/phosphorylase [Methylobacterium tardum]
MTAEDQSTNLQAIGFDLDDGVVVLNRTTGRLQALNGTAGAIWKALYAGLDVSEAADFIAETYAIGHDRARTDVDQVVRWIAEVHRAGSPDVALVDAIPANDALEAAAIYDLGDTRVAVIGPPSEVTRHIAIVLSPHRASGSTDAIPIVISGGHDRHPFILRVADRLPLTFDLAEEAIGAVFQAILELRNPNIRWLAILHGASLSLHGHGIVLSATSGSGKSTLTAALARRGFAYHADDMVALATPDGAIVPWPAPHSLKRGCWSVLAGAFPELSCQPIHTHAGRDLRLIAADRAAWDHPLVSSSLMVFPRYDAAATAAINSITPMNALVRLLEDRLFLGHPVTAEAVESFLNWLVRIPAYDIVYPDTDAAERILRDLLAGLDP